MSRTSVGVIVGLIAVALVATGMTAAFRFQRERDTVGGAFVLEDTGGRRVTDADLRGKPSALFFGFTMCPDVCPTTLTALTNVMQRLGERADRLNDVYVTVDPQRDTPAVMKDYLSSFDSRIRGLTGTESQVAAMTRAYHVLSQRVPLAGGDYTMDHSAAVLTFDRNGKFVGAIAPGADEAVVLSRFEALTGAMGR